MADSTHAQAKAPAEHALPLRVYFGVFAALLVLTAITVYISGLHFGAFNLVVAMSVAAVKASLVALIFMHLKYDNKVYMMIFVASIFFLAIFIMFTLADTLTRGDVDAEVARPIDPRAIIYQGKPAGVGVGTDTISLTDTASTTYPTLRPGGQPSVDSTALQDTKEEKEAPADSAPAGTPVPQAAPDSH